MSRYKNEGMSPVAITQSDTTVFTRPLKGIWVLTADAAVPDTLTIVDIEDVSHTVTLPLFVAGAGYPIHFQDWHIKKVMNTGTTLSDSEMYGER